MDSESNARLPISPAKDVQGDFAQFKNFMIRLMAVPHSEVKAKLDAEKRAKKRKKSRSNSASPGSAAKA